MTDKEILDLLWRASKSQRSIREDWLDEFVRHPEGLKRLTDLLSDADAPTQAVLASLLHQFADAPRRNASNRRRKTVEAGASWQRELARYLHAEGPQTRLAKYRHIPQDGREEPLSLCDGRYEITRRKGESRSGSTADLIRCSFDDGRDPEHITFSTFERYLKETRPR